MWSDSAFSYFCMLDVSSGGTRPTHQSTGCSVIEPETRLAIIFAKYYDDGHRGIDEFVVVDVTILLIKTKKADAAGNLSVRYIG